jgi:hypothetical protein
LIQLIIIIVLKEGIVLSEIGIAMKSQMNRQLSLLKQANLDEWERAVFESINGQKGEDADWYIKNNHAGYYAWI